MKKIVIILSVAFLIIIFAMISLVKKGVSLRTNTLISPSEIRAHDGNIAAAVAQRLFPDLQTNDIILVGIPAEVTHQFQNQTTGRSLKTLADQIAAEAGRLLGRPIHQAVDKMNIQNCEKLCWVLVSDHEAQELEQNLYIDSVISPLHRPYFTLNLQEFDRNGKAPNQDEISKCEKEKFLDFKCLGMLSIKDSIRKMKDPNKKYFFMKKYQDRGHYLFLEAL